MTAAEKLEERNEVMLALADADMKLTALIDGDSSYRAAAECRELIDIRTELAVTLITMGGQPGPAPITLSKAAVAV